MLNVTVLGCLHYLMVEKPSMTIIFLCLHGLKSPIEEMLKKMLLVVKDEYVMVSNLLHEGHEVFWPSLL